MEVRPVAEETFAAVKAGLPPHVAAQVDDACIKRFIRASGGKAATVGNGVPLKGSVCASSVQATPRFVIIIRPSSA